MAGYDPRIARAFASLGYDTFPFEAFDENGRLKALDAVTVPDHYKQAVGRIAAAPVWAEIYNAIAQLGATDHRCYMVGVRFLGDTIALAVFKSTSTVAGAQGGHHWSVNYGGTVAQTVSDYAGRSYIVDPSWAKLLSEVITILPEKEKKGDPKDGGARPVVHDGEPEPATAAGEDEQPPGSRPVAAGLGVAPWALLGLRLLQSVLANWTLRTKVLTTVWWYPPAGQPPTDRTAAGAWSPIHTHYTGSRKRTVHGIWSPASPETKVWWGEAIPWRGLGVADMPHLPWQWCAAFYPNVYCGGPQAAEDPDAEVAGAGAEGEGLEGVVMD